MQEKNGINKNDVLNNVGIFAKTSPKNMKEVCQILKKYNLMHLVEKDLHVLRLRAKNAEELLNLYYEEGMMEIMERHTAKLYMNGYEFVLSRINYLKEQGIPLITIGKDGNETFQPDLFIAQGKFEQKYGIHGTDLKAQYGRSYKREEKNTQQSLEENTSELTITDLENAGEMIAIKEHYNEKV